ncbi:RluA family pseudouridine synthase [Magnetovibrio sp. PR-2]|uniref:RluA family pseudouridine synthase n=1 Tax=Magnetovibrio sp. PR-2 TaxID=3120356 RepID=UPI002FCE0896
MSGVQTVEVKAEDDGLRLDKWFKKHYPGLTFGRLQKLLRKGEVRVDGKKAKEPKIRLEQGQSVRVPPLDREKNAQAAPKTQDQRVSREDAEAIRSWVLHEDQHVIVLNKPSGIAVQGGSGTKRHIDGMLEALKGDRPEKPRLVHRIDKDTSGLLVLARSQKAAQALTKAFRTKDVRKAYWAIVVGVPEREEGRIELPLGKRPSPGGEKMVVDPYEGKRAVTEFKTIDNAGKRAAWVEMEPITGRTHQLRVHMTAIETPILGDGKYGGQEAFLSGLEDAKQLHLHARAIRFPHPGGGQLELIAPLPKHMEETWAYFGFDVPSAPDPFSDDLV